MAPGLPKRKGMKTKQGVDRRTTARAPSGQRIAAGHFARSEAARGTVPEVVVDSNVVLHT
jgi:hypothetical protein